MTDQRDVERREYAPRKLTFSENVILTVKVLVVFGLLGAAMWGVMVWKEM
jgi:hypothetical protein